MALTWKEVTAPSFNNSAGANAIDAFRSANESFDLVGKRLDEGVTRENVQFTNQAIHDALTGGSRVSNNPRVDAKAVQEAIQSKDEFDSFIAGSKLLQTGFGYENAGKLITNEGENLKNENQKYLNSIAPDEHKALMDERAAQAELAREQGLVSKLQFQEIQRGIDQEKRVYQATIEAENQFNSSIYRYKAGQLDKVPVAVKIMQDTGGINIEKMKKDGASAAEIEDAQNVLANQIREMVSGSMVPEATAFANARVANDITDILSSVSRKFGVTPSNLPGSTPATLQALAHQQSALVSGEAANREKVAAKHRTQVGRDAAFGGNTAGIMPTATGWRLTDSPEELKGNTLSDSAEGVKKYLNQRGMSTSDSDIENAQTAIGILSGNKAVFESILESQKGSGWSGIIEQARLDKAAMVQFAESEGSTSPTEGAPVGIDQQIAALNKKLFDVQYLATHGRKSPSGGTTDTDTSNVSVPKTEKEITVAIERFKSSLKETQDKVNSLDPAIAEDSANFIMKYLNPQRWLGGGSQNKVTGTLDVAKSSNLGMYNTSKGGRNKGGKGNTRGQDIAMKMRQLENVDKILDELQAVQIENKNRNDLSASQELERSLLEASLQGN